MDKNTIMAVVLSTIIIIASFILQPIIFGNKDIPNDQTVEVAQNSAVEETSSESEDTESILSQVDFSASEEISSEENIVINTNKAEIVFTTKGGDIISYKLKDHLDKDTGTGVQLSDSVTNFNRTCAIALGTADSSIIEKNFTYEKIDEYTLLFKTNYKMKNVDGSISSYVLGKKYSFKPDDYMFKLDVMIHGLDNMNGININGAAYSLRTSPQIGPHYNPKENKYENRQFLAHNGNKSKRIVLSSGQFKQYDKTFIWAGIAGKYFEEIVIPSSPENIKTGYYSSSVEVDNYANAQAIIERKAFTGTDVTDTYYMYFGPRNESDLKKYNVAENNAWGIGGKRITDSLQSSGILSWLEVILKWCLETLHKVISNWGVCIIVITIILKLILFPLSKKQSMGTLKMQELQPKMQAIQNKYKNDQQKLQEETAKLYKEANYNPASGCLPLIFQFLILISMYNLFNNYFEFRGASFIPNWIPDLSAGDSVYKFKFDIPFLGNQLRILPIIYVITQLLFGKITQNGGMTAGNAQNQATMKFMTYGMPIMFFFLFYNAPSGLLLYWIVSNVFQMGQQIVINRIMAQKKAEMVSEKTVQKTLPPKAKRK